MIRKPVGRREFLKAAGMAAAAAWGTPLAGRAESRRGEVAAAPQDAPGAATAGLYAPHAPSRVSLVKGEDRRDIVYRSLKAIEDDVFAAIGDKRVLIKPNMCVDKNPLAVTHVDAVRAVLDVLAPHHKKTVLIGESGVFDTMKGYRNNGYLALEKEYDARLADFNLGPSRGYYVFGRDRAPKPIRLVETFFDPGLFVISVARMKTHNCVVVTLALKNVLMAAPIYAGYKQNVNKGAMHQEGKAGPDMLLHFNLFHVAQKVYPDLAVIDGFESMEGDGPAWGTPFASKVALASLDALAADVVGTKIMGFDATKILYLSAMTEAGMGQGDLAKIDVVGTPLGDCLYTFKPNKDVAKAYGLERNG